ncbi:MAG: hypothetical protein MUE81_01070 [Thermoflexibacter sp.]|jgi:hypothetical protein|nr:hypothetical protein [Thermoflexibacter sp.]
MKNFVYLFIFNILIIISCSTESQQVAHSYQGKAFRYMWGSPLDMDKFYFNLTIEKQGDSLRKYQYFRSDSSGNPLKLMMDIEISNDSILLMKTGDYQSNVQRILEGKKIFYMGTKEIEISKYRRKEIAAGKNDVIFLIKDYGVVNMLSYDVKTKVLYVIDTDKSIENIFSKVNHFLEKDSTGFYYLPQK